MTTSGNSNATLLLVTGLISVGMAALGYYYLHMNSKKSCVVINDSSEAGGHNSPKTSTPTTVTEKEKIARVKSTVADIQASGAGTSSSTSASRTTSKTIAASVSETMEKTVGIEMPMLPPVIPKKTLESQKTIVEKDVESPVKVVESSVVVEAVKEVESPMLVLSKPFNTSPKQAPETPKKVVESTKQTIESPKKVVEQTEAAIESPKESPETSKKVVEYPKQTIESPKKAPETLKNVVEQAKAVTIESPMKDVEQTEAATIESPKKVVEQTEASTLEHLKQAPANPSKKKTAGSEKATELASATKELKSLTRKVSEDFIVAQAVAETASAFADGTLQDTLDNVALDQEYVQVDLTQSMTLSQSTPELIHIEDAVVKTEEIVSTSAATEDEESIVEEEQEQEQEQEQEEEHAQISSEPIKSASAEPVIDTSATTETSTSPKPSDTIPASWESIVLSPEMEAAPAQEPTTALSLDAPVESVEPTEPLSINVPAENTEEPAEDKNAVSPVDSGGSTPGKRNRNRSKKSKSKKKKGKKH